MKKLNKVLTSLFIAATLLTTTGGLVSHKNGITVSSTYFEEIRVPGDLH